MVILWLPLSGVAQMFCLGRLGKIVISLYIDYKNRVSSVGVHVLDVSLKMSSMLSIAFVTIIV